MKEIIAYECIKCGNLFKKDSLKYIVFRGEIVKNFKEELIYPNVPIITSSKEGDVYCLECFKQMYESALHQTFF